MYLMITKKWINVREETNVRVLRDTWMQVSNKVVGTMERVGVRQNHERRWCRGCVGRKTIS